MLWVNGGLDSRKDMGPYEVGGAWRKRAEGEGIW